MKTFTTYAEKKAKQFLNLLQGYTKGIRITAILILLLMGVSNAWAGNNIAFQNGANFYFDPYYNATQTVNQGTIQLAVRKYQNTGGDDYGWYTGVTTLTNIENTRLYYASNFEGPSWNDQGLSFHGWAMISNSTAKNNSGTEYWNENNSAWYSEFKSYGLNNGSTYLFVATSASEGQSIQPSGAGYLSGGYSALNSQQTINTVVDGAVANSKATISLTSYKMTGNGTVTKQEATHGTGSKDSYISAARTATTTLTVGTVATGYQFDGWYTAATGGTELSREKKYIYYPTAATTVYARFSTKQHTIKFAVHSSGHGSLTAKVGNTSISSGDKVNYGSTIVFTATPSTGYQIEGWYSNSACTEPIDNGTNDTYTVKIKGGTNVYVKFEAIPANIHNITYTEQETGWTYGDSNPTTAEEGATVTFVVNPTAGYRVDVSSDGPALTGPNANNQYTFTMPNKDVKITVEAKPEQYTITLNDNGGSGGSGTVTATYLAPMPSVTPPTLIGYTFNGYFDAASGGTKYYNANGSSAKNWDKTSNTTLYAQWTANKYTVKFNANGGSGTMSNQSFTYDVEKALTANAFTRKGYTFLGWAKSSSATTATYTDKQKVKNLTATNNSTVHLYAVWQALPPTPVILKPNDEWKQANARYAIYYWGDGTDNIGWVEMTDLGCSGEYFTGEVPASYLDFKFVRLDPNGKTDAAKNNGLHWDYKWNETEDLTTPAANKNMYDMTSTTITHLYLKPNEWSAANAWFATYLCNGSEAASWHKMTILKDYDNNKEDIYSVEIGSDKLVPSKNKNIIFVRKNPSNTGLNWTDVWNQTADLNMPTDGSNFFSLNDGDWSNGTWSTIYDNSKWTTYTEPTYDVTINITGKGSIVINGQTYEGTTEETTTLTIEVVVNQALTVTAITPADRWDYEGDATITIGSNELELLKVEGPYEICGPTTINLDFMQKYCLVTFHPNPPKGVIYPEQIGSQEVRKGDKIVQPTVVDLDGYLFGGWYPNGSEYTDANKFDFDTPVEQDLELCARWVPYEQCIFFKNNLNWDNIYVYTFSNNVWHNGTDQENPNDDMGVQPKVNLIEHGKMTRIGFTDVYYYALTNITTGFNYIAFSDQSQPDNNFLYKCNAIYRGDRSDKMQLFIPQREGQVGQKRNDTYYYSEGIWMKYNSTESGYKWSSDKNGWSTDTNPFTAPNKGGYSFSTKVSLQGGTTYKFKVNNINDDWYGKIHTMTKENCTNLWLEYRMEPEYNTTIQPNVTGEYIFTIYLGDGKVMISLEYPLDINDYRLAYNDNTTGFHPGHYIRKRLAEEQLDTVSFFVHKDYSPELLLQKCIAIDAVKGIATWETVGEAYPIDVNSTSVYNFVLQQTGTTDATHQATVLMDKTHLYTGNFYIRTDKAPGGWDYFRQEDNMIHFSSYASDHEHFTHYFCKWIESSEQKGYSNVKYTIANDYSYCISDTLDNDDVIKNNQTEQGFLPANANVRFTWNNKDNTLSRAYISGSTWTRDRFLVLSGNDQLFDINIDDETGDPLSFPEGTTNGSRDGLHANEAIFADMGNWIYQLDVHANNQTTIKLTALYNEVIQYFKGSEKESTTLLRSTAGKNYKIRLIYDFKINKLISAWLAGDETIEGQDQTLGADMMIIRHNQEKAEQLNFDPTSRQLSDVGTAYAVMTFDKYFLNNRAEDGSHLSDADKQSPYARALYWISFPFDVKLSEVFGFGEYGDYWIMEYYDGEARAKNGLWADTDTYWKYITNKNYILQKGQGYVISLNLNKMGYESNIFDNTDEVSLYFPSNGALGTITGVPTNYDAPAHECTIDRENGIHKIYDSHWNVIGVPGFADIENVNVEGHIFTQDSIHFYYEYLPQTNEYRTRRAGGDKTPANFQTMYSYMVQYYGGINWSTKTFTRPSAIAARRTGEMPSQYDLRLELTTDDQLHDQTFLLLDEDKRATAEYDVNLDLTKIMNKNASIYTLAGEQRITLSGNTLPMEKAIVPVGVRIATAGEYTFRMPDGTEGISVTLVDNVTGTHTDMLMDEYTITLDAGTIENRFYLVVDPDRTATSVEDIGEEAKGEEAKGQIKKFLIDGKLFIRTADGIFDAKGQRL